MDPGERNDRDLELLQVHDERGSVRHCEVRLAGPDGDVKGEPLDFDVLHIGETLPFQKLTGNPLRGDTNGGNLGKPERRRLGRRLRSCRIRTQSKESRRARCGQPTHELAPAEVIPAWSHAFSSFLSSLRKRQSVPWAMIVWGLDLI